MKRVWSLMTHVQVLVVVLMFMLMVAFSYYFMSGIERRHLLNNVDNIMANVQSFIETDISGMSTTLGVISENIRNMIMNNVPPHVIHNNLLSITQFLSRYEHIEDEQTISHITSVYGYFDVFDGLFLSGTIWQPPPDFIPSERPWFVAGIAANGKVGVTQPYINAQLGNTIITFSRAIFDDEGRRLGIISLDVAIERISDYIVNISINEESYGVLFDKEFRVLAHPNPDFMFSCMSEINDGLIFKERLRNGLKINEFRTVDFEGVPSVFFA
ncbi:MAG: cache domain-containing protein, partial [Treponema sp.]|nr:cache domain-containing protein [Treponema sp.]